MAKSIRTVATTFDEWAELARGAKSNVDLEYERRERMKMVSAVRTAESKVYPKHNWVITGDAMTTGMWSFDELVRIGAKVARSSSSINIHELKIGRMLVDEYKKKATYIGDKADELVIASNKLRYYGNGEWSLRYSVDEGMFKRVGDFLWHLLEEYRSGRDIRLDTDGFPQDSYERWLTEEKERSASEMQSISFSDKTELGWDEDA